MSALFQKPLAWLVDGAMCNMMHALQWRRRADTCTREELANYIARHSPMTREEFYRMPAAARPSLRGTFAEGRAASTPRGGQPSCARRVSAFETSNLRGCSTLSCVTTPFSTSIE